MAMKGLEKSPTPTQAVGQPSQPYKGCWSAQPWRLQDCESKGPHGAQLPPTTQLAAHPEP